MRAQRAVIALAIVLLPGVLLAPVWRLGGLGASEDDVMYYYPARVFFQESIDAGQWPWLNPWTGLDRPAAADPQFALWYPLTWLFAILPPVGAYAASLWVHCSLAMWGMYRLLRAGPLSRQAALFGAIAFAFCGFMLAHRAHFAMQHAAAWTPWVFWRLHRYVRGGEPSAAGRSGAGVRRLAAVACVGALQCFAGHVQIAAITALGSLVYLLAQRRTGGADPLASHGPTKKMVAGRWLIAWVCVAGLFAVQWLPTLTYLRGCTRVDRSYADFVENSWNPLSTVGCVLPMFLGQRTPNFFDQPYWGPSHQCEQFPYAGLLPLLLAGLSLRAGWRGDGRRRPWIILLIFSVLLALGLFGPVCPVLYWIPGSSLFRVPARALLLANLALAALAAATFHDLGARHTPQRVRLRAAVLRWGRRPLVKALLLVAIPLCVVGLLLPLLPNEVRQAALRALRPWNPAILIPLVLALVSFIALGLVARRWRRPGWLWLLIVVTVVDLGVIGWTIDVPPGVSSPGALLAPAGQTWLDPIRASDRRLWVVTENTGMYTEPVRKRAANTNALIHVRSLTDYGPLQPAAFANYFEFAPWGFSARTEELLTDTDWMRLYHVGWILLCEPAWPAPTDCELVTTTPEGWRLYHHPVSSGMAFLADPAQPGAVRYVAHTLASFTTMVDTWPGQSEAGRAADASDDNPWPQVVVSRLALPGWRATVEGTGWGTETAYDTLLATRAPPGRVTEIKWSYSPPALREGALISALTSLALLAFAAASRRRTRA